MRVALIFLASLAGGRGGETFASGLQTNVMVFSSSRLLGADGLSLRDDRGRGQVVQLRGVNLGGWLEWQDWMCPMDSSKTLRDANPGHNGYNFEVRNLLVKRFGKTVAEDLINTYETAWISLADLDHIQALGLNVVRLPLAYDTFLHDDGTWRTNAFERVDWLVTNAWQRGIYTILDYHAFLPPGAEQDGSTQGYWNHSQQKAETVQIWQRIAEHYRGNPAIAMFDLLNEPNNSAPADSSPPPSSVVCDLYDRLYQAIRAVDSDHLIAMEGMWDWQTLRDPAKAGYRNVVYSFHWYHQGVKNTQDHHRLTDEDLLAIGKMREDWKVPVLVGEFNFYGDEQAWIHGLNCYNQAGLSWTLWSLKNKAAGSTSWGVLTTIPGKTPLVPDLTRDSAEAIREKWQAWKTSSRFFDLNPMLKPLLAHSTNPDLTNAYAR
jgi:hypothetical protein